MRVHQDDRGFRYCDIFDAMTEGDINITVLYPGELTAWHRHQNQTDYMFVVRGALKVGLCAEPDQDIMWHYLSERDDRVLHIPAGVWHGTYNFTNEETILIYFITQKYDPSDERRAPTDSNLWKRKVK